MEDVTCNIDIELTDNEDVFGDGWDFTIDIYHFQKISDKIVRVTFMYEDEVNRREDDGVLVSGLDSWSERYVKVEENLQTLLDVITFQRSGIGLRLLPDSLEMKSRTITSHRSERTHTITLKEHDEIEARYKKSTDVRNEKLLDALRLNRLAANEENEGEKIGQLWGAVERLYGSDPPKVLDSKAKKKEIRDLIDQAELISDEDKKRLKNTVNNTYKKSKPSVIAEKFNLLDGDGEMRNEKDVKQELDYWIGTRSIQAHGEILMRNQDVHMLASIMEHIMETALSAQIKPSKYVYMVYKAEELNPEYFSGQKAATKVDEKSGYTYTPLHKFYAFQDLPGQLRGGLLTEDAELYFVEFAAITLTKQSGDKQISLDEIKDKELHRLIGKLQDKLN